MSEYMRRKMELAGRIGLQESLEELIKAWSLLVIQCEGGYFYLPDDYWNEVSAREYIEMYLNDEKLNNYPEMQEVRSKVEALDKRFAEVVGLYPEVLKRKGEWLNNAIPRKGSKFFAEMIKDFYGIDIEAY